MGRIGKKRKSISFKYETRLFEWGNDMSERISLL